MKGSCLVMNRTSYYLNFYNCCARSTIIHYTLFLPTVVCSSQSRRTQEGSYCSASLNTSFFAIEVTQTSFFPLLE